MASNEDTIRVISATELVYQLLRRHYTGCTEWDGVTAQELPTAIRNQVLAADELLGKSTEEHHSGSEAMKAYNSAVHWDEAYQRLMLEVLELASTGTKPFSELICPRPYSREDLEEIGQVFFLAASAMRWAKKNHNVDIPEDADFRFIPASDEEPKKSNAYTEGELAYRTLAELTRQFLLLNDPRWEPGLSARKRTANQYYRAGKLNKSGFARAVVEHLPTDTNEKDRSKTVINNIKYALPLVEGEVQRLEPPTKDALPGIYRTIFGLALAVDRRINGVPGNSRPDETASSWPPASVIGNLTELPLLGAAPLRQGLIHAADKRLK